MPFHYMMLQTEPKDIASQTTSTQPKPGKMSLHGQQEHLLENLKPAPFEGTTERFQQLHERLDILKDYFNSSQPSLSHFFVFITTSLLWGTVLLVIGHFPLRSHSDILGREQNFFANSTLLVCGNTTKEAKELGCEYDILSNHWVPKPCMDQDAIEEYQTDGSWFGFADENRTQPLSIETMSEMDFYYTSERDHIVHCAMLWRKQYRAFVEERKNFDSIIADQIHTMHCSQYLMDMSDNGPDYWNMPIKVFVGRGACLIRE